MTEAVPTKAQTDTSRIDIYPVVDVGRDPVARLVFKLFGKRRALLAVLVALVGGICIYGASAIDGTLLPREGFDSALSDINSAIIWLILVPIAAAAYVDQIREIPELFAQLNENRVTGLTPTEYAAFVEDSSRLFRRWYWTPIAALLFAAPWWFFMSATASSPHTWYYPTALWPWLLFNAIQYLEIYCALQYALRFTITCVQLRKLLRPGLPRPHWYFHHQFQRSEIPLEPRFLHPDGLGGFGVIISFVIRSLVLAGGVLVVITLESVNTARTVTHFSQSSGLVSFIVAAILYATVVPMLLLYPLRLTVAELRNAKAWVSERLSQHESEIIWRRIKQAESTSDTGRDEHIEAIVRSMRPLGEIKAALDTVPESLLQVSQRSSQLIVLATVVPPLLAIGYRVASDVWGWNLDVLIRTIVIGH